MRDSDNKNTLNGEKLREGALPGGRLKLEHVEDEALFDSLPHRVFAERAETLFHLRVRRAEKLQRLVLRRRGEGVGFIPASLASR